MTNYIYFTTSCNGQIIKQSPRHLHVYDKFNSFLNPAQEIQGFCPASLSQTEAPLYSMDYHLPNVNTHHSMGLPPRNKPLHVFLPDGREELTNTSYPWSAIGMIVSTRGICTGTLVGPRLVLTASHCVPWQDDGTIERMKYDFLLIVLVNLELALFYFHRLMLSFSLFMSFNYLYQILPTSFLPSFHSRSAPYGTYSVKRVFSFQRNGAKISAVQSAWDIAVLELREERNKQGRGSDEGGAESGTGGLNTLNGIGRIKGNRRRDVGEELGWLGVKGRSEEDARWADEIRREEKSYNSLQASADTLLQPASSPSSDYSLPSSFYNVGYPQSAKGIFSGITPLFQKGGNISFVKSYTKGEIRAELWKTDLDLTSMFEDY